MPEHLPAAPGHVDGYPVHSAADALGLLREEALEEAPPQDDGDPQARPADEVRVTDVRLDRATFRTTRGDRPLPAWYVTFGGSRTPAVVAAAVEFPNPVPTISTRTGNYQVSADGLTLTYLFTGAARGRNDCEAEYSPLVRESGQAVALGALEHPGGRRTLREILFREPLFCHLVGHSREVSVRLATPLGNRVVVSYTNGAALSLSAPWTLPRTVDASDRPAA